jgi:hypothetical protein
MRCSETASGFTRICKRRVHANLSGPLLSIITVVTVVLLLVVGASGQQTLQRDQQALAIVDQALLSAGGASLIRSVQDFTETGTITHYWDDQATGDVTVKGRGDSELRIDETLPGGVRTVLLAKGAGSVRESDGTFRLVPHERAINPSTMTFPYFQLLKAVQDASMNVRYLGLSTHNGRQVHTVRVEPSFADGNRKDRAVRRSKLGITDFLIDPVTLLVVSIAVAVDFGSSNGKPAYNRVEFSEYQTIDGVAVPLSIRETFRGQTLLTMQLTRVAFNTGIAESTFAP